jgi:branched-chain amino acid transport system substrate-binding protein
LLLNIYGAEAGAQGLSKDQLMVMIEGNNRWHAVSIVVYSVEFLFMCVTKLLALDRLLDFQAGIFVRATVVRRWGWIGSVTIRAVLLGGMVGVCGNIVAAYYVVKAADLASEAALNYNVLYWETNSLAKNLTERGLPNFVRVGPSSDHFAQVAVQGTLDVLAKRIGKAPKDLKVWVEHEDSNYGTSIAEEQKKLFEKAGATVMTSGHSLRAIDLTDSVLRAKRFAPDVYITAGYVVDTNLLLRTAREQTFKPSAIILVGVGDTNETLSALGAEYLNGIIVSSYPRAQINPKFGPGAMDVAKAYEAKFKVPPVATSGTNGYVGMLMLARAIDAAGGSTAYRDVIAAAKKLDVPVGTYETGYGIKLDNNGQNTRAMPILSQWQDGKVVVVYPTEAMLPGTELRPLGRK